LAQSGPPTSFRHGPAAAQTHGRQPTGSATEYRADGDLTRGCTAALGAVLEALGRPEDPGTHWQRQHDALEEGCRQLIAADERHSYNAR
jgi:hypothetical protein